MIAGYLLGLVTLPLFYGLWVGSALLIVVTDSAMRKRGWLIEWQIPRRGIGVVDDYRLRHDIWFERQWGPFLFGHWVYERGDHVRVHRWWGIGRADGRSVRLFKKFSLAASEGAAE